MSIHANFTTHSFLKFLFLKTLPNVAVFDIPANPSTPHFRMTSKFVAEVHCMGACWEGSFFNYV